MMTTLFSVSFTSCIDNEVSPVVEAIYGAQADLIAAQAAVQNAEAEYKLAEAEYKLAMAAVENANAAYTMEEVAQLKISNDEALLVYQENQALLSIELAKLALQLEEVGATVALDYALKYRTYANAAADLLKDKSKAQYKLAEAQALMNGSLPLYTKTQLETVVENAKFQVELHEAEIAILQALLDDPNSLPAQITAWENRKAELENLTDAKEAAVDMKKEEAYNIVAGWDGEDDVRDDYITLFERYEKQADTINNATGTDILDFGYLVDVQQDIIDAAQAAIDGYDTALATAKQAVEDAQQAVDDAEAALGMDVAYNGYYSEDADGDTLDLNAWTKAQLEAADQTGRVKYTAPANFQEVYVNTRIDLANATDAHTIYSAAFDALVATYNAAAAELAAQQTAFDTGSWATDLATANDDLDDANDDLADAKIAYNDAKATFEADTNGFDVTDGAKADPTTAVDDLGALGIANDANTTTYQEVTGWVKIPGETVWTPSTLGAAKLTQAQVLADIDAKLAAYLIDPTIPGGVAGEDYLMTTRPEFYLWEQNGARSYFDGAGTLITPAVPATFGATDGEVPYLVSIGTNEDIHSIIYLEVEADDDPISKLFQFNIATNMLGTDDFSDRPFLVTGATEPYTAGDWAPALTISDDDAGYDSTWDGDINTTQNDDTLTAQAFAWNAALEQAKKQYAFDNSSVLLDAAQEVYDYQKELFDNGVANLADLASDKTAATSANTAAKKAVDDAWDALGAEIPSTNPIQTGTSLTFNQKLHNAKLALAALENCDADCQQLAIDAAQHEIDLLQPSLDFVLEKIAEMQAQYDLYMETYVPGASTSYDNLDADLKVKYDTLMNEAFVLQQELDALDAELDYVNDMLGNTAGIDNLSEVSLEIELTILYDNSQGSYNDALEDLEDAEEALAEHLADMADDTTYIEYLQAKVDTLQQRYDNAAALAAKYLALMNAAIAS